MLHANPARYIVMRSRPLHAARLTVVLLAIGAISNVLVAWTIVLTHGRHEFEWNPHFNPHGGDPIAMFVSTRTGIEWVSGCGRPGTLVARHRDKVRDYMSVPWWPTEAVTMETSESAVAAGWPLLSMYGWYSWSWAEVSSEELAGVDEPHWCVVLGKESGPHGGGGHDDRYRLLLPLKPRWPHFLANSLVHGLALAFVVAAFATIRRRRRRARGACERCAYPIANHARCPECGTVSAAR